MKRKKTLIALIIVISMLVVFAVITAIVTKKDVFAATLTYGSCTHDKTDFKFEIVGIRTHQVKCNCSDCSRKGDIVATEQCELGNWQNSISTTGEPTHYRQCQLCDTTLDADFCKDSSPKDGKCDICGYTLETSGGDGGTPVYGTCTHANSKTYEYYPNGDNTHDIVCNYPDCDNYGRHVADDNCTEGNWKNRISSLNGEPMHWKECIYCTWQIVQETYCKDDDNNGKCDICGYTLSSGGGSTGQEDCDHEWHYLDNLTHECSKCFTQEFHYDDHYDNDNLCDSCGYDMGPDAPVETCPPHNHPRYYATSTQHQLRCDDCGTVLTDWESHTDTDGDGKCDVCTYEYSGGGGDDPGDHTHQYNSSQTIKEPTCTEAGSKILFCTVPGCDDYKMEEIPALGHAWGAATVTKEATCTEAGTQTKTCSRCNTTETETIPALGHDFEHGTETITKQPTCGTAGTKTIKCSRCDQTKTEDIPATGEHNITSYIDKKNGKHVGKCSVCKKEISSTLEPHTLDENGKCTKCDFERVKDNGDGTHTITDPETGIAGDPEPCQYGSWKTTKAATCTEKGTRERTCSICGHKDVGEIAAKGHDFTGTETVTKEPTCGAKGTKTIKCSRCDETKTEEIPATGEHNITTYVDKKNGKHIGKCSVCKKEISSTLEAHTLDSDGNCTKCDFKEINDDGDDGHTITDPETGEETKEPHTYGAWKDNKNGKHERVCTKCGHKQTERHTLDTDGKCTKCDFVKVNDDGDDGHTIVDPETGEETKEPHTYGDWEDNKDGTHSKICSKCLHEIKEKHELDANGDCKKCDFKKIKDSGDGTHTITDPETGKETKEKHKYKWKDNKDGTHTGECTVCGSKATEEHELDSNGDCKKCDFKKIKNNGDGTHTITDPETGKETTEKHKYEWKDNKDGTHTGECTVCGDKVTEQHTVDGNNKCTKCDYKAATGSGDGSGSGGGTGSGSGSGSDGGNASGKLPNTGKETIIIGIAVFTLLVGIGIFKNRQYKDI